MGHGRGELSRPTMPELHSQLSYIADDFMDLGMVGTQLQKHHPLPDTILPSAHI